MKFKGECLLESRGLNWLGELGLVSEIRVLSYLQYSIYGTTHHLEGTEGETDRQTDTGNTARIYSR